MAAPLSQTLARCRDEGTEWEEVYNDFVGSLRRLQVGESAPHVGDRLPGFALPNSRGLLVGSEALLEQGPLVLSFNRGGWCPYCRSELAIWAEHMPQLRATGGAFVAVTGEVGGRAERMRCELGLDAEMLCDIDHGLALDMGLAFMLGAEIRRRYLACGLDLTDAYGSASWFLPIPATYVIDRGGIVRFAFVDPDFRVRAEPGDVLEVVRGLGDEGVAHTTG